MPERHLVFLPGLLCDHALWAHQAEHLAEAVEVMVGDLTRDDSIPAMAGRILEEAPDTFSLAGLSMGGYVAQEIMRQEPERVERLALIDTQARADSAEQVKTRKDLIRLATIGKFKGVTPRLLPNLVHRDRLDDPAVRDVVLDMAGRVGQEAFVRQQTAILGRKDGREDLRSIRVPTVVICGAGGAAFLMRSNDNIADMGLSMAVPHTSPSPWAAWVSPTENSAPGTSTGRNSSVPAAMSRVSMLPPTLRGGMTECDPGSAGATPMVPVNGFNGTRAWVLKMAGSARPES